MRKEEFLEGLQQALSGEVPSAVIQENLRYYRDYIQGEVQKGRDEAEVMAELGDSRLIAHTIIDTTPGAGDGAFEDYDKAAGAHGGGQSGEYGQQRQQQNQSSMRYYNLNAWYWKIIGIAVVILVIVVIVTVVGGVLSLVIPMLPVIGLVALVMWFVRGGGRR